MTQDPQNFIPSDRWLGLVFAAAIHVAFLFSGGLGLLQKAEFGMSGSDAGYEGDLIAALPVETGAMAPVSEPAFSQNIPAEDDLVSPDEKVVKEEAQSRPIGDGSSPVPGNDPITRRAGEGAFTEARPGYFRNPPPLYPEAARQEGQEGLVLLAVTVSEAGLTKAVSLAQSSGFQILDDAAAAAVRKWKFKPARINGIKVESEVEVPLQFKLDQ